MKKISDTDRHDSYVHTGDPNPEQPNAEEPNKPGQHAPIKKDPVLDKQEGERTERTGTR